jgi:predicted ATPase
MGKHRQGGGIQVMAKITKKAQRAILKDIRRQLVWIEQAIKDGDQDWIDEYANQISATGLSLHSETMSES